jgi:hypothetical protein
MIRNWLKSNFPSAVHLLNRIYNHLFHLKYFGRKRENVFRLIYRTNHWLDSESHSGPGSTLEKTKTIREKLPHILKELKIKSMLDIPCGDFHWMKHLELTNLKYVGMDIVAELIHKNQSENSGYDFRLGDLVRDPLPSVDLVFCRDCFVHLSYADIQAAINNLKKSQSLYLLTTSFPQHKNFNIVTGNWRPVNLQAAPFNFPAPILFIREDEAGDYRDKSLALWKLSDLP